MKSRKEIFKTGLLMFLVALSIFLTYIITTYRPDYEIFNRKVEKKENSNEQKVINSLNIVAPDIIYKLDAGSKEEKSVQNAITKVAQFEGVKNKDIIKNILLTISNNTSQETRVKKNIKDVLDINSEKIIMEYCIPINSASLKPIFFGEENSSISLEVNKVLLLKDKPDTIYIYKNEESNYIQIDMNTNVYEKVKESVVENKEQYGKYILNDKPLYIPEYSENYYIDEYSVEDVDVNRLAKQIFQGDNFRTSENELTDGYSILRQIGEKLFYVNPSNEISKPTTIMATTTTAVEFLTQDYLQEVDFKIIEATEKYTVFQEVYKDSLAFDSQGTTNINIQSNEVGVYQAVFPKKYAKTYLSSQKETKNIVERPEYVLNYLYANFNLKEIDDIVLGYKKEYSKTKNSFSYTPTWYIKYKGKYEEFKTLKTGIVGRGS